jgi:S-adenosylmethionine:tRNA ribosyltransferase-isomerase
MDNLSLSAMIRPMQTSLFDYHLPPERIAQQPMEPREAAKLLLMDRKTGALQDKRVGDLPELFQPGDLLIFNDSKVFKARLQAKTKKGKTVEIFLLRPEAEGWLALAKPGRALREGDTCFLEDRTPFTIREKNPDGTILVDFGQSTDDIFALTDRLGKIPLPPYIESQEGATEYQTVYAKERGSVAAPTAGFHFTESLLKTLDQKGIKRAFVTLHVGMGTFRPMKMDTLEEHVMHEEWIQVPDETKGLIEETKKHGGRVIAIGTTATRALESDIVSGFTHLFITPGYKFKTIDGLMTNFHLPKSTLLVLVSAFAGRERVLNAYDHAIKHGYRFYSFGDAMVIL